jgi:L-lactate dehydrogenase complex protein LldF
MLPILLMEPDSTGKRRRFSKTLLEPKHVTPHPSVEDIKSRLKEIREHSLAHLDALREELSASLIAHPDVEFSLADDAAQAVQTIKEISDGTPIAISRSAVVTRELMPAMIASGLDVIETYNDQFQPFENRFDKPGQLPAMESDPVLGSFDRSTDLVSLREASLRKQGSKSFTGLLGVNAISAKDGAVVLLQHMHNISEVFTQADKLILVASLDKIVEDMDAAVFQTMCMAIFGWEALPLSLRGGAGHEIGIDSLPFEVPTERAARKIHLIVFDNGRSRLMNSRYADLIACIECRACMKSCPAFPFFEDGAPWSPKEYIYFFVTGKNPSLELCLQCKSCRADCPLDIDLPGMILDAKIEASADTRLPIADSLLSNFETMARWGSYVPSLANVATENRLMRWLEEKMLGISRERQLPQFQRTTLAKWFRSSAEKT